MKNTLIGTIFILLSCSTKKTNNEIPSVLFDTLKDQIVLVTDTSFKQSYDYNINIARLNFLNLGTVIENKDSFVLRLFIDTYRKSQKEVVQLNCNKNNITGERILFQETFDGTTYLRSNKNLHELDLTTDKKIFFQTLLKNQLLTLNDDKLKCPNDTKDGTTYSIQLVNHTGQKFYSCSNPQYFDSSCVSGVHFNNIIETLKIYLK